jgi:hypothetical protein
MQGQGVRRLIRRLIEGSLLIGVVSTFSYATELHNVLRAMAPAAGAWWNQYEFHFMEGAATALGLLIALRIGLRFAETELGRRLALAALVLDAVLVAPLTHLCAAAGRVGADGTGAVATSRIASFAGYADGKLLDKLLIAGVYFLKTAAFGFLLGLGLFGAMMVGVIASARGSGRIAVAQPSPADPR